MRVTIKAQLLFGYIAVLGFMIIMSILAYITLGNVNRSMNQILAYAHKYDMVGGLRHSTKQFIDVSDSLIKGQIQDAEYYRSVAKDVEKKILYVGKLRLKENEQEFLKKITAEFNSMRALAEGSLRWTSAARNTNLASTLRELDRARPIFLINVEGLSDEAWRSLDNVTILAGKEREKGVGQIITFSIIAIIAGIGISTDISRMINTQIMALSAAVSGVAKGDLNQMMEKASGDEIGELVLSFNQMLIELKTSREQVEKSNRDLKATVEDRTTEMEETKKYLEKILEYSGDIIITTTLFDEIVEFNKGSENILGYNKGNMVGSKIENTFVKKNEYGRIRNRAIEEGGVSGYIVKLMKKSGDIVDATLTLSRLEDRTGNVVGLICIGRGITGEERTIS